MAYVQVPKDLNAVKTKVMFNLTKRQLICFGSGAITALPVFFLAKPHFGTSAAGMLLIVILMPFLLFALYEKNGRPFEKIAKDMINVIFKKPSQRPYKTKNYYSLVEKQIQLDKEVHNESIKKQ